MEGRGTHLDPPSCPRTSENSVNAKFAEDAFRDCPKRVLSTL
jgi:hypothetical protein